MSNEFWEQYKDPRWQKKRLEIFQSAGFTCETCERTDVTLHVHHAYYEKGKAPWEYPDESLHCLCEECHQIEEMNKVQLKRHLGTLPLIELPRLYGYICGLEMMEMPPTQIEITSFIMAEGIADCWGIDPTVLMAVAPQSICGETCLVDGHMLDELRKATKADRSKSSAQDITKFLRDCRIVAG